jgi:hypothetical protein
MATIRLQHKVGDSAYNSHRLEKNLYEWTMDLEKRLTQMVFSFSSVIEIRNLFICLLQYLGQVGEVYYKKSLVQIMSNDKNLKYHVY